MRSRQLLPFAPVLMCLCAAPAQANITIVPTYGSSITTLANASAIEGSIQSAINVYQQTFVNPITVNIDFENITSGLGQSETSYYTLNYNTYQAALTANATDATQRTAYADSVPFSPQDQNPVNRTSSVNVNSANVRALGLGSGYAGGVAGVTANGTFDSVISLNTATTFPPNGQSGNYDLQAVASHEIDEALGFSSLLTAVANEPANYTLNNSPVAPLDLFRYSALGVRSFSLSSSATAFFSTDGGSNNIVNFNQSGGGTDYNDWASGNTNYVQDARIYPGAVINLATPELTALNVIGYNFASAAPEPSSFSDMGLIAFGLCGLLWKSRKRKAVQPEA